MNGNTNTIPMQKGFDPMKYLRQTVNEAGEPVLRLPLTYQKFWFRQTHPNGRMLLKPLRLTDQLAIFEALVYLHREDQAPAGSFTANKTAQETSGYIRAAQDEALSEALDNAGFGLRLDAEHPADGKGRAAVTAPVRETAAAPKPQPGTQASPARTPAAPTAPKQDAPPASEKPGAEAPLTTQPKDVETPAATVQSAGNPAAQPPAKGTEPMPQMETADAPEPAPVQTVQEDAPPAEPIHEDAAQTDGEEPAAAALLNFPSTETQPDAARESIPAGEETGDIPAAAEQAVESTGPQASYTEDMPVEQICQLMTLEEARQVVVTKGTCNGWTMAQVAEKRPSSLRFYISGYGHVNNIQLAAATLLQQDMELKKAG